MNTTKKREIGALKFSTGTVKYFIIDNFVNYPGLKIYPSLKEATEELKFLEADETAAPMKSICRHTALEWDSVHFMLPNKGAWWGKACPICNCIPTKAQATIGEFVAGDPAWSPWTKKANAPAVPGFSFSDWLEDEEKGGDTND